MHRTNLISLNSINHKLQRHGLALFIVKNHFKTQNYQTISKKFEEWKFKTKLFEWRMNQSLALADKKDSKFNTQRMQEILAGM